MKSKNILSQEAITRRLAIIRFLYQIGMEQSHHGERMAFPCILSFHDAVEFFLRLVAEKEGINADKLAFSEYWFHLPDLTLKESMRNFNSLRVNLKHYGQLPANEDLAISRVNVTTFLRENTKTFFQLDFESVSLINIVGYKSVREYLKCAQDFSKNGEMKEAIENVAIAFSELIFLYEESKQSMHKSRSPFHFGDEFEYWGSTDRALRELNSDLARSISKMKKNIEALQEAMKITALGIDFKKYSQFRILTPRVHRWHNEWEAKFIENRNWSITNVQFCIDFVIESALKLQEFDFELDNLIIKDYTRMEYVSGTFETGITMREVKIDPPNKDHDNVK